MRIVPAILATNITSFKKQWQHVAPYFDLLQIDIMDGQLVKSKNIIEPDKIKIYFGDRDLEIHLMVKDVRRYLTKWIKIKNVKRIIWHWEANTDPVAQKKLAQYVRQHQIKAGLAVNPKTDVKKMLSVFKYFDLAQVMDVDPGQQGQKFQTQALNHAQIIRHKYPKKIISLDGGINDHNFRQISRLKINQLVIGSYLQKNKIIKTALKKIN